MKRLPWIPLLLLAAPLPLLARTSHSTNITISAQVDKFAEWADPDPIIFEAEWSGHLDKVHQARTVSKTLTLYTNTAATISARPGLNQGVLSNGSQSLATAYRITGSVTTPDITFKPAGTGAGEFFSAQNVYTITRTTGTGSYLVNLEVQMNSPPDSAPDPGIYTCGLILTAEW